MREQICLPENCTLCMACANSCPRDAIFVGVDEYGYEKIKINPQRCVECGLCEQVCKRCQDITSKTPLRAYAAQAKCTADLMHSASGGAFQMLAQIVLEQNGVCYGCALENDRGSFGARHIRVEAIDDLPQILNSKYIPSRIGEVFRNVKADLDAGKRVLFSGTPCQVQGLKAYLNREYEHLLTADIICHGIAATKLFNDYIENVENRENIRITEYLFRDKSVSWGTNFCYNYYKKNDVAKRIRKKHCPREASSYMMHYLRGNIFRENCYDCPLSATERVSDFTLGDFWEIEREYPEFVTKSTPKIVLRKGVSCILENTEKAAEYSRLLEEKMVMHAVSLKSVTAHNGNLRAPSSRGGNREWFLETYREHGYGPIEEAYRRSVGRKRTVFQIKNFLKTYLPDRVRIWIYQSKFLGRIVFHN